ncbi:MAG: bifunctional UDP-N-acetylglucosamine diphosphorylase/glucosamine-1-phosphate N-acetyltransferase GlmU [Alphaproteobacteria bacterium]|nr:bifunctional UDP-N-acetylglucosamine diphosphorylase/glucosamine-1-phosphate N-acetyltransferase GlmU [Alphaproteobacteria bacterium]
MSNEFPHNRPLAVVVLAAGKGTRMKSDKPKVMHELAGLPMINWLLKSCEALNPDKIIVVTGPDMPELEAAVKPHQTVVQETRDGTGGAVRVAAPLLAGFDGDVLIVLGDAPLMSENTMRNLVAARGDSPLSVLGCLLQNPFGYGRLILNEQGFLHAIVEEKDATPEQKTIQLVNTGVFCVDGAQLSGWLEKLDNNNAQGEFYITQLPEIIGSAHKMVVSVTPDVHETLGCNTRADLATLEGHLQNRLREQFMESGVVMRSPETVHLWHDTQIGEGTFIEPNVIFGPKVKVGKNVTIKGFSHLEGATVKAGAILGPFARLRPDSVIGKDAKIGNFVEIKKSKIGDGSKINHLAYVGDCEMGERVNFSAGAITVNYDGFQKHKTIIGKDVMVGSNVNLVAPLHIDDGAFVAAGSTINEDVPADALSIARDTAKIRKGWAAEFREKMKQAKAKQAKKKA